MKVLLKKEVCGSREQCTGPMYKTLVAYRYPNVHLFLKKKKKKNNNNNNNNNNNFGSTNQFETLV